MSSKQTSNLDALSDTYELIGELTAKGGGARAIIGKRRSDGADVLITIVETPPGDEGNALSHVAADVNLLSALEHRSLAPVFEGRWLDHDAFAVVRRRIYAPTLDELLASRDEEFAYPRIAVILQELNGLLEWARAQKVVHRALDLDTVHVEPGSDRVFASFAIRALPLTDMPGAEEDARTIATLARTMLTRSAMDPDRANLPLAELRPGLPNAVIEQTEALLANAPAGTGLPDVNGYIASVAMADAIKRGETACDESKQRIIEEERRAREQIEAHHRECERIAAERERTFNHERAAFLKQKVAIERALAREKESVQRALAAEWEALGKATPVVRSRPPRSGVRGRIARWWRHRPEWSRSWTTPAATAAALLIAMVVFATGHDERDVAATSAPQARVVATDSAAGAVVPAPGTPAVSVPDVPPDLVTGVATRAAAAPPVRTVRPREVRDDGYLNRPSARDQYQYQRPAQEPIQYRPPVQEPQYRPPAQEWLPQRPIDTARRPETVPRVDSFARPQIRINLDSVFRARRDSLRRDTLVRRDTFPRPRD